MGFRALKASAFCRMYITFQLFGLDATSYPKPQSLWSSLNEALAGFAGSSMMTLGPAIIMPEG